MKVKYVYLLVVLSLVASFSVSNYAQGNKVIDKELVAKKAYQIVPQSLNSEIPGIVESSIYNLVEIKKYYPSGDYSDVINKLNNIAQSNPNTSIRIKAYLASIYLSSNGLIDVHPLKEYYDHDYLFKQIATQLENKLLVSK